MFRLPQQRAQQKLARIIPVAQTQVHQHIAVTITSLDCYEHGFDIHLYIWRDVEDGLLPHFSIRALFDGKRPVPGGGSASREIGTHDPSDPHWYFSCRRDPSPDQSVREVRLFIPVIHLAEQRPHDTLRLVRDVPGPWVFVAPTSQGKDAEGSDDATVPPNELDEAWANPEHVHERREKRQRRTMP